MQHYEQVGCTSHGAHAQSKRPASGTLYTARGARKYLTRAERGRLLPACGGSLSDCDLLLLTLAWTGARISEALALTPAAFHVEAGVVAIRTLKTPSSRDP